MPENTDHPTQKPEKLLAKIVLASSKEDDVILDPFLGDVLVEFYPKEIARLTIGIEYFGKVREFWLAKPDY